MKISITCILLLFLIISLNSQRNSGKRHKPSDDNKYTRNIKESNEVAHNNDNSQHMQDLSKEQMKKEDKDSQNKDEIILLNDLSSLDNNVKDIINKESILSDEDILSKNDSLSTVLDEQISNSSSNQDYIKDDNSYIDDEEDNEYNPIYFEQNDSPNLKDDIINPEYHNIEEITVNKLDDNIISENYIDIDLNKQEIDVTEEIGETEEQIEELEEIIEREVKIKEREVESEEIEERNEIDEMEEREELISDFSEEENDSKQILNSEEVENNEENILSENEINVEINQNQNDLEIIEDQDILQINLNKLIQELDQEANNNVEIDTFNHKNDLSKDLNENIHKKDNIETQIEEKYKIFMNDLFSNSKKLAIFLLENITLINATVENYAVYPYNLIFLLAIGYYFGKLLIKIISMSLQIPVRYYNNINNI